MGLPFTSHHGGQILFGPSDGYLYYMMGDGGRKGDPFNFSQEKKSLLGKIMRLDVNNIPSEFLNEVIYLGNLMHSFFCKCTYSGVYILPLCVLDFIHFH